MVRILVVEDDVKFNRIVCSHLNGVGYAAKGCPNASEAYDEMYANQYDIIVTDVMMPKIDGFEFAENVRSINKSIPILFMTALEDFASKEKGYRAGIDDYMVKPINLNELVLRIGALVRRADIASKKALTIGNLSLNIDENSAVVDGEELSLTAREFNILFKLLANAKRTFSRAQLMDEFWGLDSDATLRAVDVYIARLREKLSDCDGFKIVTVHGVGYKAVPNET